MNCTTLAKLDSKFRALAVSVLPPQLLVKLYSSGRKKFLEKLVRECPVPTAVPENLERKCWGISFRSPIFNASGMFKNGEGYEMAAAQGAGAFLAGTSTATERSGNRKGSFFQPFAPYPESGAASNWLGLPNPGDVAVAARLKLVSRRPGCPVGSSIGADPGLEGETKAQSLIRGMNTYADAGIDFLELNESCPNTASPSDQAEFRTRLEFVSENFLRKRPPGTFPVIVKLSNDLEIELLEETLSLIMALGFDGINFGNTSTRYAAHRQEIAPKEQRLYDFFTENFGGGVSGRPLRADSLRLTSAAAALLRSNPPGREFHIIRTGGVMNMNDVRESLDAGASLVQWYSGYFESFAAQGHDLYRELYSHS